MTEPRVSRSLSEHTSKPKWKHLLLCVLGLLLVSGVALSWRARNQASPAALLQQAVVQQGGLQPSTLGAADFLPSGRSGILLRNGNFQDDWITVLPENKNHHWNY